MNSKLHSMALLFALACFPSTSMGADGLRKPIRSAEQSIECDVQLAVGQVEEGPPQEILHCSLDSPDELGNILYEINGLEEDEFIRIKNKVTSGGQHRYEFPGATRSQGKPAQTNLFGSSSSSAAQTQAINVPKSKSGMSQAIEKESDKKSKKHRSLYKLNGVSTVLAVRIIALDEETSSSVNDCRAHTFGGLDDEGVFDDMNMKTQIDACSYGKLKFVEPEYNPTYPDVVGGVVTITLNQTVTDVSHGTVLGWARDTTPLYAGPLDQYDHVMYFMPPGVAFNGAAAFGYMPGQETWYMDSYSLYTGIQLHELGHNLGLGHSGEDGGGYGDSSCYMGYGGGDVRMCYNAAKNWYLGWYEEFHHEFNPLTETSKLFRLVGLSDYEEALTSANPEDYTVVLRIETFEEESLYLTYNRQKGVNSETKEFQDKVTVVRAEGRYQSWIEAGLSPGQKYSRAIVDGSGRSLEIVVCDRVDEGPDYAEVSVHPLGAAPLCTPPSPITSWETYDGQLHDSLVAHYTFDNDYLDTSGNSFHAFEFGNLTFTDGAISGQALQFDGEDGYLELPNVPELDFGETDFTITFWYRVDDDQVGRPAIIGNKDWRSTKNPGWIVSSNFGYTSNGDDLAINLGDGIVTLDGSKAMDVSFDTWHFVAVRIKRGDKMSLLRANKGSYALQEDNISTLTGSLSTGNKIRIGTSHGACEEGFTKMDLDDLGIWSRALSSEEVEKIWMAGKKNGFNLLQANNAPNTNSAQTPSALISKYDFENNLLDSGSNYLHGALLNDGGGLSFSSSPESGYINLNNVDFQEQTFVTLPDSSLYDFGSDKPFTVSLWQRTSTDFSSGGTSIISNKDWWSGRYPGWTLGLGSDGRLEWNVGDGTNRCDYDGPAGLLNDGEWHHIAFSMTRGSSGQVTIYLDGKIVHHRNCEVASVSTVYPIVVGTDGRGGAGWSAFFTGNIDKVLIFGSALEHAEMFSLYSQGRSNTATFAPSISPTTAAPTGSPTKRPTASPITAPPTSGPDGPFYIRNPSSNKVLTISGGTCDEGSSIIPLQNENEDWQKWWMNNDGTVESVHCPGMVLDTEGSQCGNSVLVVLSSRSSCSMSQVWEMQNSIIVNSKCNTKAIDIASGSRIIIWSTHGNSNQLWQIDQAAAPPTSKPTDHPTAAPSTSTPSSLPPSPSPTTLAPSTAPSNRPTSSPITSNPTTAPVTSSPTLHPQGPFYITNPSSGKLLTAANEECDDGSNIELWQSNGNVSQMWMLNHDNTIESVHCPGKVISITQCANLASVILASRNAQDLDDQAWILSDTIVNVKCNTRSIDIKDGSQIDGATIILWDTHGSFNQIWQFFDVPTLHPSSLPTAEPSRTLVPTSASPTTLSNSGETSAPNPHVPTSHPSSMPTVVTSRTLVPTSASPTTSSNSGETSAPSPSPTATVTNRPTRRFSKTSKRTRTTAKPTIHST